MRSEKTRARGQAIAVVLALIAFFGLFAVAASVFVVHRVRVERSFSWRSHSIRFRCPFASLRFRGNANRGFHRLSFPVYPGARRNTANCYVTCDQAAKVLSFYRRELPDWNVIARRDGVSELRLVQPSRRRMIEIQDAHGSTRVTFTDSDGEQVN